MTKKLEEILNLPDSKEIVQTAEQEQKQKEKEEKKQRAVIEQQDTFDALAEFDKITTALPQVKGLGSMADTELNEVAHKAMDAYEDLMDLGMNVESRYSGRIFEVAGSMLKTGLDAKVAKIDKKLKMVELQIKKEKMDRDRLGNADDGMVSGEGYVVTDRNSLLEKLKGLDKDK